ncbi:MAG TPA: glycosyltransferase [Verrucomicrobiae bacterium]|nr:glycosyltransferase [Verrucomicrobiae bacterium]
MASEVSPRTRVVVDGKFFRLGEHKFYVKGIAYGPLAPGAQGLFFASPEQTRADLAQIRELGANVLRVYHVPPRRFLDAAAEWNLKVLIDIPWNKHLCFDSERRRSEARRAVRTAVQACANHPAVFAYSVANEFPPDIVRWAGTKIVARLVDDLITEARNADPGCLCTFTNFPPTEFLQPQTPDFICFNVYLHDQRPYRNYLSRLQLIADSRPLILGEFGIDSLREGEARKCEALAWQIENAFRGGLAGTVVFTYTDEWFRGGRLVDDWQMGLVTADRRTKESFGVVRKMFHAAPYFPLPRCPKVSVVVASYNAERTLLACLDSLRRLNYPDYEVILVDDGSTDRTSQIAGEIRNRYGEAGESANKFISIRHERNFGLSAARNTGIAAASGEVIAFTDADCRADEDWLYYLVGDLLDGSFAGIGGPNLLPPEDSYVASAVMVSPGGPMHVMLTDRRAEHIPGCNMAFYKSVLQEIGGFDPTFRKAGDDVDLCWRLQQCGYQIGFSPSALVWHYRRSTVSEYLKQQRGYGEAESMLVQKHPENFNAFGDSIWRGRIYGPSKLGLDIQSPVIYHGLFGSADFQKLYTSEPASTLMLCTTLGYYAFVLLPLWVLTVVFPALFPLAFASLLLPIGVCAGAAVQAALPRNKTRWWSRPLVGLLFFLQPIVRGWARHRGRLAFRTSPVGERQSLDSVALRASSEKLGQVQYWSEKRLERLAFITAIAQRLDSEGWSRRSDIGWSEYDLEIYGSRWSRLQLTTVAEDYSQDRQMIRCRLRSRWSLAAQILFWAILGIELLVIGMGNSWRPWSWLLLLSAPVMVWWLRRDQRTLQSVITVLLDELAREYHMAKVPAETPVGQVGHPLPSDGRGPG